MLVDLRRPATNLAKRGVAFSAAEGFEWDDAVVRIDARREYGERRLVALGSTCGSLHSVTHTPRDAGVQLISLRKANKRALWTYENES